MPSLLSIAGNYQNDSTTQVEFGTGRLLGVPFVRHGQRAKDAIFDVAL